MSLSLDDPLSGSGDHENVYGDQPHLMEIYDPDGKLFNNCKRKAVNIREIREHTPWHSLKDNPLIFSDLSGKNKEFIRMTKQNFSDEGPLKDNQMEKARNSVRYTKAVNSSYG